jgi:hypothetical protein
MPNNDDQNQTDSSSNFGLDNQGVQQNQVPFTDLYTLLQLIRKHPILILGLRTDQVTVSTLSAFIKGYEMALEAHDIDEFGSGFEKRFGQFLRAHCLWYDNAMWPSLIVKHAPNETDAVLRFYELVDEFYRLQS